MKTQAQKLVYNKLSLYVFDVHHLDCLICVNEQMDFKNKAIGRAIIAIVYFHFGFYHMSSPIGTTYVMEIVPYALRSKASTLYQMCTNGWILFNNYVNNLGMDAIQWRYYIVFCVWLVIQATIVCFFFS